MNKLTTKCTKH